MIRVLTTLSCLTLCAALGCSGAQKEEPEAGAKSESPTAKALKRDIESVRNSLNELTASLEDRETKDEPGTVRYRIAEEEEVLREKTAGFRRAMNELFGGDQEMSADQQATKRELEQELEALETELEELGEKTEESVEEVGDEVSEEADEAGEALSGDE